MGIYREDLNIEDHLALNILLLKVGAAWPGTVSKTKWKNVLYKAYKGVCISSYIFCTLSVALYCIFSMETYEDLIENLAVIFTQIPLAMRFVVVNRYARDIYSLISVTGNNFFVRGVKGGVTLHEAAIIRTCLTFARRLTITTIALFVGTTVAMVFHPLTATHPIAVNGTEQVPPRILPFKSWYPFQKLETPYYELEYTLQATLTILEALFIGSVDLLMACLFHYVTCQFDLLSYSIKDLSIEVPKNERIEKTKPVISDKEKNMPYSFDITNSDVIFQEEMIRSLKVYIRHHQSLFGFCELLRKIVEPIVSCHITFSTANLCLLGFHAMVMPKDNLKFMRIVLHLVCLATSVWFVCFFGSRLISQSENVSRAAFECDWRQGSSEFKRMLNFLIMRAQKPVAMSAGLAGALSMPLFTWMLRSSYSFLALLRQLLIREEGS